MDESKIKLSANPARVLEDILKRQGASVDQDAIEKLAIWLDKPIPESEIKEIDPKAWEELSKRIAK